MFSGPCRKVSISSCKKKSCELAAWSAVGTYHDLVVPLGLLERLESPVRTINSLDIYLLDDIEGNGKRPDKAGRKRVECKPRDVPVVDQVQFPGRQSV